MSLEKDLSYLLDRFSNVALYKQVENIIKHLIETPPYSDSVYLPGENELISRFGVARHTVRQALQNLVDKGILIRERGKGTKKIACQEKIHTNTTAWSSFTEEMAKQGYQSRLQFIETGTKIVLDEVNKCFETANKVAFLLRRYGFSKTAQTDIYFESYFHPTLELDKDQDFQEHRFVKLYEFLKAKKKIIASSSKEKIEIVSLSQPDLFFLKDIMNSGIPLIKRTRIVLDQNGKVFEYNIGYYRSDVFVFHFESSSLE